MKRKEVDEYLDNIKDIKLEPNGETIHIIDTLTFTIQSNDSVISNIKIKKEPSDCYDAHHNWKGYEEQCWNVNYVEGYIRSINHIHFTEMQTRPGWHEYIYKFTQNVSMYDNKGRLHGINHTATWGMGDEYDEYDEDEVSTELYNKGEDQYDTNIINIVGREYGITKLLLSKKYYSPRDFMDNSPLDIDTPLIKDYLEINLN